MSVFHQGTARGSAAALGDILPSCATSLYFALLSNKFLPFDPKMIQLNFHISLSPKEKLEALIPAVRTAT